MIKIIFLNELFYHFLERTNLTYSYRKSNYGGRLDQGYWFYGNETYLAVSFWSGMDWKNRTPNIIFVVTQTGNAYLEINVSDSDRKRDFVKSFLVSPLSLGTDGRRFRKYYADNLDLSSASTQLEQFIVGDKLIIDEIIKKEANEFFLNDEEELGFIDRKEFRNRQSNIFRYRKVITDRLDNALNPPKSKPSKIHSFKVWNFGPLKFAEISGVPVNNQWIFITGENGSGKTSMLRAIGTALGHRPLERSELKRNGAFKIEAQLSSKFDDNFEKFERSLNEDTTNRRPKVAGLCMYGPFRLLNSRKLPKSEYKSLYTKTGAFGSLFTDNAPLLDIDKQLDIWKKDAKAKTLLEKRQYYLKNILTEIVPNLYNIDFRLFESNSAVIYQTRKNDDSEESNTNWEDLSSGTKSVFSLIVDILLRLYDQQPKIVDPSELKGVVIIDEIDLHLHPLAQKNLVINLSNVFRDVQFIVTTHSPIPLLGAPKNSMIYVMHNLEGDIGIERMDDKVMFSKILPNAIFSSPIFGLENLLPDSKPKDEIPYLEDDYNQVVRLENLNNDIRSYLTNEKQKELLDLFNTPKT
jgi:predicted ATPase